MTSQQLLKNVNEGQGAVCSTRRIYKRILVALDGSEQSQFAADFAARLAGQMHAEVVLLNVFSTPYIPNPEIGFVEDGARKTCIDSREALLSRFREKMPAAGSVQLVLREGDTATEILKTATVFKIDLIVMGTHGRGRFAEAIMGSVAEAVTRQSPRPVVTVSKPLPDDVATARRQADIDAFQ